MQQLPPHIQHEYPINFQSQRGGITELVGQFISTFITNGVSLAHAVTALNGMRTKHYADAYTENKKRALASTKTGRIDKQALKVRQT
jgi:hypothetical protein